MSDEFKNNYLPSYKLSKLQKNTWIISFVDLLSVLLVFFILIYSLEQQKEDNWQTMPKSIITRFSPIKGKTYTRLIDLSYLHAILSKLQKDNPVILDRLLFELLDNKLVIIMPESKIFADDKIMLIQNSTDIINLIVETLNRVSNKIEIYSISGSYNLINNSNTGNFELSIKKSLKLANEFIKAGYKYQINNYAATRSIYLRDKKLKMLKFFEIVIHNHHSDNSFIEY